MNSKLLAVVAGLLVAIFGTAMLYTAHTPSNNTASDIKIGVILGLTGSESVWAENNLHAMRLATDEINKNGGVNGRTLSLVVEDDQSDSKTGLSALEKLTTVDHVDVLVGDVWSYTTNPLITVSATKKIVLISPTVMDTSVEGKSSYFFTLGHTVVSEKQAMETFFTNHPEVKTVYELCWSDDWGKAHSKLFAEIVAERKLTLVGHDCTADYSADYRIEATKIKAAHPDAVYIVSSLAERAVKALRDSGVQTPILTTSVFEQAFKTNKISANYLGDVWFTDWIPNDSFVATYESAYHTYPITEAQNSYETIRSIAKAFEANPNDLQAGLGKVSYAGVEGALINFTQGDPIRVNGGMAKLYQLTHEGAFVEVK